MICAIRSAGNGGTACGRHSAAPLFLGLTAAVYALAFSSPASAFYDFGFYRFYSPDRVFTAPPRRKFAPKKVGRRAAKESPVVSPPPGPLQVIVSIADQRVTVYANGQQFAQSNVSTGKKGHSTPTGVFSVLEKSRHHRSNLYSNAPMPYMQRLTWSGIALHAGELPGYPASHGCIRLPEEFARLLWATTRVGARVIVSPSEIAPVDIVHPRLTRLATPEIPVAMELRGSTAAQEALVQTAAAGEPSVMLDSVSAGPAPKPSTASKIAGDGPSRDKNSAGNGRPVTILVSRNSGKLQVRQGFKPLFEAPVTIKAPGHPWGTHVYTALAPTETGLPLRWTGISMPTEPPTTLAARATKRVDKVSAADSLPDANSVQTSEGVLDAFEIPAEALARLAALVTPGATLMVSDNAPSRETGPATDFIILTR
jgi:lipoprotein-anchoring transpeptidase ErfK/SrfK